VETPEGDDLAELTPSATQREHPATPTVAGTAIETLGFRTLALPLGLITSIIISRTLLPAGRGSYVLSLLIVTIVTTALGSMNSAISHQLGSDQEPARVIVGRGLALAFALGLIGAVALAPAMRALVGDHLHHVWLAAAALPSLLVTEVLGGALIASSRVRAWNFLQAENQFLVLSLTIAFVPVAGRGVDGALEAWVLAQALFALSTLAVASRVWWPFPIGRHPGRPIARLLALSVKLGLINLVSLANYRIELFVLQRSRGLTGVGVYSLAVSVVELLWLVPASIAAAITAAVLSRSEKDAVEVVASGVRATFAICTVGAVAALCVGVPLLPVVFGASYRSGRVPLAILLVGGVAFAPASLLAIHFSVRHGRSRDPLLTAAISCVVTGGLALVLAPRIGASGAAIASSFGYSAGMGFLVLRFCSATDSPLRSLVPSAADVKSARLMVTGRHLGAARSPHNS
jgi:O-antigen/teichoic acid export membrane protein